MHLNELKALHVSEVLKQAEALEIENTGRMRKQELMFAIIKKRARAGEQVFADGVLEILPDGLRFAKRGRWADRLVSLLRQLVLALVLWRLLRQEIRSVLLSHEFSSFLHSKF